MVLSYIKQSDLNYEILGYINKELYRIRDSIEILSNQISTYPQTKKVGYEDYQWSHHEQREWLIPKLNDLVVYQLMHS